MIWLLISKPVPFFESSLYTRRWFDASGHWCRILFQVLDRRWDIMQHIPEYSQPRHRHQKLDRVQIWAKSLLDSQGLGLRSSKVTLSFLPEIKSLPDHIYKFRIRIHLCKLFSKFNGVTFDKNIFISISVP